MTDEDELEFSPLIVANASDDDDYEPPLISTPGRILVEVWPDGDPWKYEVHASDDETSVFWIGEGVGFDYWLDSYCEFKAPGLYLIENVRGEWIRGDGWTTDDDEEWECDAPRAISVEDAKALGFEWEV